MKPAPRNRCRAGLTVVEVIVGMTVVAMVLLGVINCTELLAQSADNNQTDVPLVSNGRASIDEALYEIRGGSTVLPGTQMVNGANCKTDSQNVVLSAPAYNPSQSGVVLTDASGNAKTDLIALQYDAQAKQLLEYVQPAVGSTRTSRTKTVIARNVSSVAYTYHMRHMQQQFNQTLTSVASQTLNLNATANILGNVTATVSVAGGTPVSVPVIYNPALHVAVVAALPIGNVTITIDYDVSEKTITSTDTVSLPYVSQVDVQLQLTGINGRAVSRTVTVAGSAFLRNNQRPS